MERSKEKTDVINYRCKAANVEFVFEIFNDGVRKTYTVRRTIKRDKSGTHKAMLFENDGETELCIADKTTTVEKKIVEILGVDAEDFRKCIALPQGEFAQFVKSAPRERLALIERLFNLHKYGDGLKEKISLKQSQIEAEYSGICGKLAAYEDVTDDAINGLLQKISEEENNLVILTEKTVKAQQKLEKIKLLNVKLTELETARQKLAELINKKPAMEELRKGLKILPACRETVKIAEDIQKNKQSIVKMDGDIAILEAETKKIINEIEELNAEIAKSDFDENIARCVQLGASYLSCADKPQKLKELKTQLENKRMYYKRKEEQIFDLKQKRLKAEEEVLNAENALKGVDGGNLEQLFNVKFKAAVLKDEYVKQLDYFSYLSGGVEIYSDDSPLYEFIVTEIKKKKEEYKQRILDVKDFKIADINAEVDRLRAAETLREKLQTELTSKRDALQKINAAVEVAQTELSALKNEGEELRARTDEIESELKKVFGDNCTDFSAAISDNDKKLQSLKDAKQRLSNGLEDKKSRKTQVELSVEKLKLLKSSCESEINILNDKLTLSVFESGFKTVEECKAFAEEFSKYEDAEKTIADFDKQFAVLEERVKSLSAENYDGADENALNAARAEYVKLDEELKTATGNLAVLKANAEGLKEKSEEKKNILKDSALIERERNLLAQLKEITKGNKFLEYLADEYLCDISSLASTTLLKLTDGRYFLSFKDNNFYVGDNYDCGNLRGVNTLSGGETFLVSLSLALALSQTICAKSLKSIEFFFLDEGFGTLDSTLVETVLGALDKLKSSHFTIGIISHVEELKNRIDNKITVIKATEKEGSKVVTGY